MQDWEYFNHSRRSRGASDDPWDRQPASSVDAFGARRPESARPGPGPRHRLLRPRPQLRQPLCAPGKSTAPCRGVAIILVAALVIFGVSIGITRILLFRDTPASGMSVIGGNRLLRGRRLLRQRGPGARRQPGQLR